MTRIEFKGYVGGIALVTCIAYVRVTGWLRIRPSVFHGDEGRRVGICHSSFNT